MDEASLLQLQKEVAELERVLVAKKYLLEEARLRETSLNTEAAAFASFLLHQVCPIALFSMIASVMSRIYHYSLLL